MINFKRILRKIFFIKEKEPQYYITQLPQDEAERQKYINKKLLQKQLEDKATIIKQQKEIIQLKKKGSKEKLREEKKLISDVQKELKKKKKIEWANTILWKFVGVKSPTLYPDVGPPIKNCYGFSATQLRNGIVIYFPVVKTKNGLKKVNIFSLNPLDFFKDKVGYISKMKAGKIDANIHMLRDGSLELTESSYDLDAKLKARIISDSERQKYEQTILELMRELKEKNATIGDHRDKESKYEKTINEATTMSVNTLNERNLYAASNENLMKLSTEHTVATQKAMTQLQEAEMTKEFIANENMILTDVLDGLKHKWGEEMSKTAREKALRDIKEQYEASIDTLKKFEKPTELVVKKEEKK